MLDPFTCADCGNPDPAVLEFDHDGDRTFVLSAPLPSSGPSPLVADIGTYELVCGNCHRRRAFRRNGGWEALLKHDA